LKEFIGIVFVDFQAAIFYFEEKRKDQIADGKKLLKKTQVTHKCPVV